MAAALLVAEGCLPPPGSGGLSPAVARADSVAQAAIRNEQAIDPATFPERSIGVVPLAVATRDTTLAALGWGLADLLTTDLARSRALQVVERVQVDALMRELDLAASGRVDSSTAPKVGRLLGARQLVTGAVTELPDSRLELNTRLADVVRGQVSGVASQAISLDLILDAEKALAFSLLDQLGVTLTPAERAAIEQRPTRNIAALLAYSRGVRDEALGDYRSAVNGYQDAVRLDPSFGQARTRLQGAQATVGDVPASGGAAEQLRRTVDLAAESINRGALPITSDAADAGFRASTQQLITLIIRLTIP